MQCRRVRPLHIRFSAHLKPSRTRTFRMSCRNQLFILLLTVRRPGYSYFCVSIPIQVDRLIQVIKNEMQTLQNRSANYTLLPHHYNKHCTPNLESHNLKSQSQIRALLPHKILPTSLLNPNSLLVTSTT
jgi:hypothetical protein